jgi:hypothetical protein
MLFYRALHLSSATPPLSIRLDGGRVVIDWPEECAGCVLEETLRLGGQGGWSQSAAQPRLENGRYAVRIEATALQRFYRLRRD